MQQRASAGLLTVLLIGIAILYLPLLVLIGYSFNASPLVNVWGGFSTAWYGQLLHDNQLLSAALLSLEVAVAASSAAVVLGTLAAISLVRFSRFRGRLLLTGMVNAPLVMPEIITGITQLLLFVSMVQLFSWPHRGFITIVISHVTFCTAGECRSLTGRGRHGSRCQPGASVPRDYAADHYTGDPLQLVAVLHLVAR
jgi:putrescine transport system permease protein